MRICRWKPRRRGRGLRTNSRGRRRSSRWKRRGVERTIPDRVARRKQAASRRSGGADPRRPPIEIMVARRGSRGHSRRLGITSQTGVMNPASGSAGMAVIDAEVSAEAWRRARSSRRRTRSCGVGAHPGGHRVHRAAATRQRPANRMHADMAWPAGGGGSLASMSGGHHAR